MVLAGLGGLGTGLQRVGESGDPPLLASSPVVRYHCLCPAARAGLFLSSCLWGVVGEIGRWVSRFPFRLRLVGGTVNTVRSAQTTRRRLRCHDRPSALGVLLVGSRLKAGVQWRSKPVPSYVLEEG